MGRRARGRQPPPEGGARVPPARSGEPGSDLRGQPQRLLDGHPGRAGLQWDDDTLCNLWAPRVPGPLTLLPEGVAPQGIRRATSREQARGPLIPSTVDLLSGHERALGRAPRAIAADALARGERFQGLDLGLDPTPSARRGGVHDPQRPGRRQRLVGGSAHGAARGRRRRGRSGLRRTPRGCSSSAAVARSPSCARGSAWPPAGPS